MRISRDFVWPVPVTIVLELSRKLPGDFRQKRGKLIGGRFETDGKPFRRSFPSNRFLLPSRLRLFDIVFIIGLKPSAFLRACLSSV